MNFEELPVGRICVARGVGGLVVRWYGGAASMIGLRFGEFQAVR